MSDPKDAEKAHRKAEVNQWGLPHDYVPTCAVCFQEWPCKTQALSAVVGAVTHWSEREQDDIVYPADVIKPLESHTKALEAENGRLKAELSSWAKTYERWTVDNVRLAPEAEVLRQELEGARRHSVALEKQIDDTEKRVRKYQADDYREFTLMRLRAEKAEQALRNLMADPFVHMPAHVKDQLWAAYLSPSSSPGETQEKEKPKPRTCNRHVDCDQKPKGSDCCHDDCCSDCFGD